MIRCFVAGAASLTALQAVPAQPSAQVASLAPAAVAGVLPADTPTAADIAPESAVQGKGFFLLWRCESHSTVADAHQQTVLSKRSMPTCRQVHLGILHTVPGRQCLLSQHTRNIMPQYSC